MECGGCGNVCLGSRIEFLGLWGYSFLCMFFFLGEMFGGVVGVICGGVVCFR